MNENLVFLQNFVFYMCSNASIYAAVGVLWCDAYGGYKVCRVTGKIHSSTQQCLHFGTHHTNNKKSNWMLIYPCDVRYLYFVCAFILSVFFLQKPTISETLSGLCFLDSLVHAPHHNLCLYTIICWMNFFLNKNIILKSKPLDFQLSKTNN